MIVKLGLGCGIIFLILLLFYWSWTFILNFILLTFTSALAVGLYHKNTNRIYKSKKMLYGRTVLVTGGTSGMGLEIAKDLAHRGARVIITGHLEHEGLKAKENIEISSGSDKVVFKLLDFTSLKAVREFASDILIEEDRLDVLINNAGSGEAADKPTEDGLHNIMQINYFGPFLLTMLLLPLLKRTGEPSEPSRIVNTVSIQHKFAEVDYEHWNDGAYYKYPWRMYSNSKLCLVMFSRELSKKLRGTNVVLNMVDPGAVGGTNIFSGFYKIFNVLTSFIFKNYCMNAWEGVQTALYVSVSDEAGQVTGKYFWNCRITEPSRAVYNEAITSRLWDNTAALVDLKDEDWNYDFPKAGAMHNGI